jgi:hypothetical protein
MVNLITFPLSASQTPLKYQMQDFYWSHLFRPAGYTPFNVSDIVGADGMAGAVRGTAKERFLISIADYHRFQILSSFYFSLHVIKIFLAIKKQREYKGSHETYNS